ncbi:L,D-transpeptidase [Rubritalea marina]|uniref:L,D-transpeptidase n=1 Tax=Rubritalea marina TaxID=361055 RepID=UPI0003790CE6|nr:L,D-transpeptidase [Rubritalea marina]
MPFSIHLIVAALLAICFASCTNTVSTPNSRQKDKLNAVFVNPYSEGTYDHFVSSKNYPDTYSIFIDPHLLEQLDKSNTSIEIDLQRQRGYLLYNNEYVAMDYPVSTGQSAFPTPRGEYRILKKIRTNKRSNLYGKIYDADGNVTNSDANINQDPIPAGGKFVGASMKYWMRISWEGLGMHQGKVPRYPVSHGCIRTYYKAVPLVYDKVSVGTPVVIR